MTGFVGYLLSALQAIFTVKGIAYILGGSLLGMFLGCIPGLSGGTLITLLLPIFWKMDPVLGLGLLIAIHVGSVSGGSIGSILLGIPGTSSAIATVWDGYEFTKQGDPVRALSAATVSGTIGRIPGLLFAAGLSSWIAIYAVKLGPWEYSSMCFAAVAMVITLSKKDIFKGLMAIGLAIIMSSIGQDIVYGTGRLTFGSLNLYQGFNVINILLGLFAAKIILLEFARKEKENMAGKIQVKRFRWPGKDLKDNIGLMVRSFITGAFIGFLPGIGGQTSTVMAYSNEKAIAKNKELWGHGAIGGVIAPEIANSAGIGGALIPMLALGIPGDGIVAQFMVALNSMDIATGPLFIKQNPDIVYMIFTGGIVACIFMFVLQMIGMPLFPMMLRIPYQYLYPAILIICFIGSYVVSGSLWGVLVMLIALVLAIIMDYFDIPALPFLMTFILSGTFERNLRLGFNYSLTGGLDFFTRPVSLLFILVGVFMLCWGLFGSKLWAKRKARKEAETK